MSFLTKAPSFLTVSQMEEQAKSVREQVGWMTIPIDPFAIASRLDVEVLLGSFDDDSTEGVLRTFEGRAQILVRVASSLARQKFTVAHEIGHYILHWMPEEDNRSDGENFVDDDLKLYRRSTDSNQPTTREDRNREIQANMFASALLIPKPDLIAFRKQMSSVKALANIFGVSEVAMRYRIGELDVW